MDSLDSDAIHGIVKKQAPAMTTQNKKTDVVENKKFSTTSVYCVTRPPKAIGLRLVQSSEITGTD